MNGAAQLGYRVRNVAGMPLVACLSLWLVAHLVGACHAKTEAPLRSIRELLDSSPRRFPSEKVRVRGWAFNVGECEYYGSECLSPVVLACFRDRRTEADPIAPFDAQVLALRGNERNAFVCGKSCRGIRPGLFYEVTGRVEAIERVDPEQPLRLRIHVETLSEIQRGPPDELCLSREEASR